MIYMQRDLQNDLPPHSSVAGMDYHLNSKVSSHPRTFQILVPSQLREMCNVQQTMHRFDQ